MTLNETLIQLRQKGVELWVEDGRLRYEAPMGALMPALLAALREHRAGLIESLQMATWEPAAKQAAIRPMPRTEALPVSFAQQRLWLLDQLEPAAATYNIPCILEMNGPLNVPALERALSQIVRRHEALRTTFPSANGNEPVQEIAPAQPVSLPVVEVRDAAAAQQQIESEARRPFDLAQGQLVRLQLLRLGPEQHVLQLNVHHIVFDAWSLVVFARELSALYEAFVLGRFSPLAELPIQYADYAGWQRDWLQGAVLAKQRDYWRQQLAGASFALELPTDYLRPPAQTYRGATLLAQLPKELRDRLKDLSQREGVTLYMTLLAAFQVLLHRYSGQDDILVASPSAGRDRIETETLIGLFVNTLALRANLARNPSFRELLQQVRETALDAFANRDIPFEKLVEELRVARQLNRSPLCQVMFTLQNTPALEFRLPRLQVASRLVDAGESKFDLTLALEETADGLAARLTYCTDLFAENRMRRLLGHYQRMLEGIVADPEQTVGELPLLTTAERHQLLVEWNATATDYPQDVCLHELVERQAQKTPDAIAVVCGDQQLTYSELNVRANQLAQHLIAHGVKLESFVGICLERSVEMVVALCGVLKAGAAYVPIDPTEPAERLTFMLADADMPVLLTQLALCHKLPVRPGCVICLDADWAQISRCDSTAPATGVTAENLAYMIYTSDSTGQPNGALNTQRGIVNRLLWMQATYPLDAADVVLQETPFSSDVSVWEIFWPLIAGARLVVARPDGHRDPDYLVELITRLGVTVVHFVPSMLQYFLEALGVERCRSLRHVFCSGETLLSALQEQFTARLGAQLHNLYGPTEAAVNATAWTCRRNNHRRCVPIGRPSANTQIYILDRNLQPLPISVPGELHIGGVQVGRGYHNRPELTAEKFISDPFRSEPGARLYKTGDLARYLPDGSIEYLGRADQQVKVRGYRIELGEIQAVLQQHPQIRECVVISREDTPGDKSIVAYVVGNNGALPNAPELRDYLRQWLPEYMLPAAIMRLWLLPLRPNGKVDYRALPTPIGVEPKMPPDAPRTATQKLVASIWAELLHVPNLGIHDNFFAVGGHSLLAVRIVARLRGAVESELPLRTIFEKPTVAQFAGHLDSLPQTRGIQTEHLSTDRRYQGRTMTLDCLLTDLREKKIELWVEGDQLRYRAPDQTLTPELLELVREHKPELIGFLRAAAGATAVRKPVLQPVVRAAHVPLSFAQQRLWLLDQIEPNRPTYNIPLALRLRGTLDVAALEQSLNEICRRHEVLRTTFSGGQNGEPCQVIAAPVSVPLPVVDLRGCAVEAEECLRAEARRPFNLAIGPVVRWKLLQVADDEHALLWNVHHIAFDGWSIGVLARELSALYGAFVAGQASPLPELPVQYVDFAAWQRDWLRGEVLERQLTFWKKQLAGSSLVLELPADRPRPPTQSTRGADIPFELSKRAGDALEQLGRREGATLFMTLLAAFQVLLHRHSGQDDIIVGAPVAGRDLVETEGLIGFFVNTVPVRGDLSGNPSFRQFLQQIRETALGVFAHQDIPFEKLVEELQPSRDLSRSPLFQVMFLFQNTPVQPYKLPGVTVTPMQVETDTAKFDLGIELWQTEQGLRGRLQYCTDLFDEARMRRLLGHFATLLDGIVANPDQRVGDLPLLTAAERQETLVTWNATAAEYPQDICVPALIEAQAWRTPDAVAAVFGDATLTYRQLNQQADQLAAWLREQGVGPEQLVGLNVERSLEMLIAVLGVSKAGGAYLPLDPLFPAERLAFMTEDAKPHVILTREKVRAALDGPKLPAVAAGTTPDNLAYVLYTSGSTGKPKGVQITQRAVVNFLASMRREPGLTAADVLLAVTTLSFDIAGLELLLPLTVGARVVIASRAVAADGAQLARLLAQSQATVLQATPATWRMLLQSDWPGDSTLKMLCGGEALPADLAEQLLARGGELWNLYGPTETTIWSAASRVERGQPVVVGRPIANTTFYVVDQALQPVPVGVPGELLIGGHGVARGYLNRPELTAEKFIANRFGEGRLYRTGDLVRYCAAGTLEFLGRLDHQVKVRGFRIELGEIEALLRAHDDVKQAAVTMREDTPGDKRLVAYIVPAAEPAPNAAALRTWLKKELPDYMVPAAFVTLAALPLTPNGKVDRKALPAPEHKRAVADETFVAPRDPLEEQLVRIWGKTFGHNHIGVRDNFFELGGHSLLAVRLFAQVARFTGKELPLVTLFQAPTIEQLAGVLRQQGWESPWSCLVPIKESGSRPPFYCVHGVGGNILEYLDLAKYMDADQPFYGIQAGGLDGKRPRLNLTVEGMAAQYLKEIRAFQPQGPYYIGGSSFGGTVAYEIAQQLRAAGAEVGLLAFFDTNGPDYPQYLPGTTAWQRKLLGLRNRVALHWDNLRAAEGRHRLEYVWVKAQKWARGLVWLAARNIRHRWKRLRERTEQLWLPATIRQVQQAGRWAALDYVPKPYAGQVALFRATEQPRGIIPDPTLGWGKLVLGGFEIYDTPGHHGAVVREPRARVTAQQLRDALSKTQGNIGATPVVRVEEMVLQ